MAKPLFNTKKRPLVLSSTEYGASKIKDSEDYISENPISKKALKFTQDKKVTRSEQSSTPKKLSFPVLSRAKPLFQMSAEKTSEFKSRCEKHGITTPKDIHHVRNLIDYLHLERDMSFLNFGDTLQHSVNETNSNLLTWGHEHLSSPLTETMVKATAACQEFYQKVSPKQTPGWKFWTDKKPEKSTESHKNELITAEAYIEIFTDALTIEKPKYYSAYANLETILQETDILIHQLHLHSATLSIRLENLIPEMIGLDSKLMYRAQEAKSIMESKKDSFTLMESTLNLQIAQIKQMASQQRQRILNYDHVASITFPLWRTHALAYVTKKSVDERQLAWNNLMKTQELISPTTT